MKNAIIDSVIKEALKQKYMYHVSSQDFRDSILKYGLDPRKLADFGFERSTEGTEIYLFDDLSQATHYRYYMSRQEPEGPMDIWIVNVTGLKLKKDYGLIGGEISEDTNTYYSEKPIPRTRIKLL